ncbi:MAG: helix-turn-helix transcriptional regulator [Gaiellaceae bacterium]
MITNERQHRITKAEIRRFEQAIVQAEADEPTGDVHPRLHHAMIDGLRSQLEELQSEVSDYEALREGKIKRRVMTSLLDLPSALIEGRIARHLTQRDLGRRLGVPEQQIQRYEKTRYAGVSLERLQQVADAVGLTLKKTVEYDVGSYAGSRERSRRGGSPSMASRRTGKAAASAAGKTLASKSASKTAKRAAASDLAQVRNQKVTGKKAASSAGKTLASKSASKTAKRAAASDLSQAARKKKR